MRLAAAVAAVALLSACAGGQLARRPSPPPKAPWVVHPEAEVMDAKNAHDYRGAPLCQRCHSSPSGKLTVEDEAVLCYQCHAAAKMTHVGKLQKPPPKTLPFEAGGRIVCHTCHDPHDLKAGKHGLRGDLTALCLECHARH